jgi:hypothetical protein
MPKKKNFKTLSFLCALLFLWLKMGTYVGDDQVFLPGQNENGKIETSKGCR